MLDLLPLAALILALPHSPDTQGIGGARQIFPGAVPLDEQGAPTHAVTCVLDARSGRPIAGARLSAVFERPSPWPGSGGPRAAPSRTP
jgi:hypothetical protein